ncbi:MAG: hypothetical protein AAFX50_23010, partial [Acidobacteriota bacterium]
RRTGRRRVTPGLGRAEASRRLRLPRRSEGPARQRHVAELGGGFADAAQPGRRFRRRTGGAQGLDLGGLDDDERRALAWMAACAAGQDPAAPLAPGPELEAWRRASSRRPAWPT